MIRQYVEYVKMRHNCQLTIFQHVRRFHVATAIAKRETLFVHFEI